MWSVRMVQAVPGIALMARGETSPLLIAGIIRATALGPALLAVHMGLGLIGIAAAGVLGELASAAYVIQRTTRDIPGLGRATIVRTLYPLLAALMAASCMYFVPHATNAWIQLPFGFVLAVCAMLAGLAVMPRLRLFIDGELQPLKVSAVRPTSPPPAPTTTEATYAVQQA